MHLELSSFATGAELMTFRIEALGLKMFRSLGFRTEG